MNISDGLTEHLQDVPTPAPDLRRVVERGQRLRARRRVTRMTVVAAAVLAGLSLVRPGGALDDATSGPPIASGPCASGSGRYDGGFVASKSGVSKPTHFSCSESHQTSCLRSDHGLPSGSADARL